MSVTAIALIVAAAAVIAIAWLANPHAGDRTLEERRRAAEDQLSGTDTRIDRRRRLGLPDDDYQERP